MIQLLNNSTRQFDKKRNQLSFYCTYNLYLNNDKNIGGSGPHKL